MLKIQYYGGRALGGGVFHIGPGIAGGKKSRCCIYGGMYVLFGVEVKPRHQVAVWRLFVGKLPQCVPTQTLRKCRRQWAACELRHPAGSASWFLTAWPRRGWSNWRRSSTSWDHDRRYEVRQYYHMVAALHSSTFLIVLLIIRHNNRHSNFIASAMFWFCWTSN